MIIYNDRDVFQGTFTKLSGIFAQSTSLTRDVIAIEADVVEVLRIEGCEFIEATVETGPQHVEVFYANFQDFLETATNEWNHDKQCFEMVYRIKEQKEPDERREMRESLQP